MIDRVARNHVLEALDDLMEKRITLYDFVCRFEAVQNSQDPIIREVDCDFADCFEDYPKQFLSYNQWSWKYFNRLRLLLASDAEQIEIRTTRWSVRQVIAFFTFCLCVTVLIHGYFFVCTWFHLALFAATSLITAGLWIWRFESWRNREKSKIQITSRYETHPFCTFSEVVAFRKSVPNFVSKRYRPDDEPPRPPLWKRVLNCNIRIIPEFLERYAAQFLVAILCPFFLPGLILGFVVLSPFILLYFTFPETRCKTWWCLGERMFVH